jgi:pyruvate/2-oxoglutarate dehydrogenase complex dihydrolipoamide dehydrogenase (E3) component
MTETFDLIVIGAGSAGRAAAARAADAYDARVALVESTFWGGSCPNVACQPTKAYLVAAELARDVAELGPSFGMEVSRPALLKVRAWKESLKRTQDAWEEALSTYALFKGEASLVDASRVEVAGQILESERILIATGSRTSVPPIPGLDAVPWIDHVSALELTELPETLVVIGAGPIGLEFAQVFARLGSRVTVVDFAPRIAPLVDADAAAALHEALEADGLDFVLGAGVEGIDTDGDGAVVRVAGRSVGAAKVLLAAGRVPNVEALGLDRIGVEASRRGIRVDERMRTSVPGIWAAGDVADGPQFTPVADYQGGVAVDDMFGGEAHADYSLLPTAIFTDPELAGIGLTEAEAEAAGHDVDAVTQPLSSVTRAYYTNSLQGLFKVVFDRATRRVLGIHVVSRGASDIVGSLALGMKLGATIDDVAGVHYVYPSFSEGVKEAALLAPAAEPATAGAAPGPARRPPQPA